MTSKTIQRSALRPYRRAAVAALACGAVLAGMLTATAPALAASESGTYTKPTGAAFLPQETTYLEIFNNPNPSNAEENFSQLYTAQFTPDGTGFPRTPTGELSKYNYNAIAFDNRAGEGKLYVVVFDRLTDSEGEGEIATVDVETGEVTKTGKKLSFVRTAGSDPVDQTAPISATMDDDGNIYYTTSRTPEYAVFNVDSGSLEFHSFVDADGDETTTTIADWTFLDGHLWGRNSSQRSIIRVNPDTGEVTPFAPPAGMIQDDVGTGGTENATGAMFTFANGNLGFQLNRGELQQVRVTNPSSANPTFKVLATYYGNAGAGTDGAVAYAADRPDLALEKTATPKSTRVGDTVNWTLEVTNNGPGISTGYIVTDEVPAEFADVASDDPSVEINGNDITIQGGRLDVGESRTYEFTSTTTEVGEFVNVATVDGNEPENNDNTEDNTDDDDVVVEADAPAWTVQKTDDAPEQVVAGDTVNYTVTATNTGNVPVEGATVTDDLSDVLDDATLDEASLAASQGDSPVYDADTQSLVWSGDLAVGASVDLTYSVTVNEDAAADAQILNAVVGTSPEVPSNCVDGTEEDCFTDHGVGDPGLDILKTDDADGAVTQGQTITYTVIGENTGNVDLTNVVITDDLSDVVDDAALDEKSFAATVGDAPFYDAEEQTLVWTGDLAVGEKVELTYGVTVNQDAAADAQVRNAVVGTSEETPSNCLTGTEDDCFTDHGVGIPGLDVVKTDDAKGEVERGQELNYSVTGTNTGNTTLTDVVIVDDLSDVLDDATLDEDSLAASAGDAPVYNADEQTLTWTGTLAQGEKVELTYTATVDDDAADEAVVRNAVTGTSAETDSNCLAGTEEDCFTEHDVDGPVTVVPGDEPDGSLAATGADVAPWLIGCGAAVLLAGAASLLLSRRRRALADADTQE